MDDLNRSVTFTLTADDHVAANKLFMLKYATSRWPLIFWLGCTALLLGMFFVLALQMHDAPCAPAVYICFTVLVALPFFQYFVSASTLARRSYAGQKTLQHPMTVSWSTEGFRSIAQQGDWNIAWGDYLKWAENDKVILLYQGAHLFNMLPKRILTLAQVDDIRQVVGANVKRA
jgi:hypothetical protein